MKKGTKFIALLCSFVLLIQIVSGHVIASAATSAISKKSISLTVDQTSKIVIKNKVNKATYTFKSSDKEVATVSKAGVVTGISEGTATVTVSCTVKKKVSKVGTVKVTVEAEEEEAEPTVAPTATPTPAPSNVAVLHDEILKKALVSTGNNTRLKKAIEKARNGEPVTMAYIGGSITDGANATPKTLCYANLSYEYFKKTFGKGDGSNVKFVNAGLSGTPSTLGMIRYNKDVVQVGGTNPDIVFIEFAVNDIGDPTNGEGYESLIRNILKADNKPAVVLLFSIFRGGASEQARLQPIGEYYNLPMVSIHDGIESFINGGKMKNEDFFHADGLHPTTVGHQLYADCITNMFDKVDKEPLAASDIAIPDAPKVGKAFDGIQMIDCKSTSADYTITPGSFNGLDYNMYTSYHDSSRKCFPNNWMHKASSGNDSMKISITCKNFVIAYKACSTSVASKIDITVDGKKYTVSAADSNAWGQALNKVIFKDDVAAKHEIEIKMADDSVSKEFTIMAIGYTK